jgi:hypothetical protein
VLRGACENFFPKAGRNMATPAGLRAVLLVMPGSWSNKLTPRLALQLPFRFEVGSLSDSLTNSAPE